MPSTYIAAAITGDNVLVQDASLAHSLEHKIWIKGADITMKEQDIFQGLEGKGSNSVIETETATSSGNGLAATYPLIGEFGNAPKLGSARFSQDSDFEGITLGSDAVRADYFRFATSSDDRAEEVLGMRNQLTGRVNELLGRRVGKLHCHHALMTLVHRVNHENVILPRGVGAQDDIYSDHTLTYEDIVNMEAMLAPLGGEAFRHARDENGNEIRRHLLIPTSYAGVGLKNDPTYKANLQTAGVRGKENCLFAGGYPVINGSIVREFKPIDQPGPVTIGCPLSPKAWLGTAITSGTGALDILGGGKASYAAKTEKVFFEYFPKYAYPFLAGDLLSWSNPVAWKLNGSGNFYVTIVNPSSATVDPGKWAIYEISANNGNELTVDKRLAAATAGIAATTVGGVTWNASENTETHPEGSLIYLSTSRGVPLGATPMLGARALRRAIGKVRLALAYDKQEGGFINESYVMSIFGHGVRKDLDGRVPAVLVMKHAISYEGWKHPRPIAP